MCFLLFQEAFTCVRTDEMNIDCTDSEKFYELNRILGLKEETSTDEVTSNELTLNENDKSHSDEKLNGLENNENNQRFKVQTASHSSRIQTQTGSTRNQPAKRTTAIPYSSATNTEKVIQTTNYREFNGDRNDLTTERDLIPSTTYSPVNIAQFFDLTTKKLFNYPTTTSIANDNFEYTTEPFVANAEQLTTSTGSTNGFVTNKYDISTRIVPELIENNGKNSDQTKTDEVVESIKQLQKHFPTTLNDSRENRFLFKADSVKNRQKLFEMLNQ